MATPSLTQTFVRYGAPLCQLYAQGQYALQARALLARRVCRHQRAADAGEVGLYDQRRRAQVKFTQDDFQTKLTGLPEKAPDWPVTTIALECESEPVQDTTWVRTNKPGASV